MGRDDMLREVWRLHDSERLPISEIARRTRLPEAEVRAMIAEVWGMPASVKAAVGIRHEWRGEDE